MLVRISGFGQTGPYRDRAGFGGVAEAFAGLRQVTGYPDRAPVRPAAPLGDTLAGLYGVVGALMMLLAKAPGAPSLGPVLAVGMRAPIAMPIAARYRIIPLLMGMMLSRGALGAAFSPITVYGAFTAETACGPGRGASWRRPGPAPATRGSAWPPARRSAGDGVPIGPALVREFRELGRSTGCTLELVPV